MYEVYRVYKVCKVYKVCEVYKVYKVYKVYEVYKAYKVYKAYEVYNVYKVYRVYKLLFLPPPPKPPIQLYLGLSGSNCQPKPQGSISGCLKAPSERGRFTPRQTRRFGLGVLAW